MENGIISRVTARWQPILGLTTIMSMHPVSGFRTKKKPTDKWITSGNRKWYRHADGSYTKNDWELINGKYYRFDKDGWMVTGWQKIGNVTYYMDKTTGERYGEGWHWIDGNCYYMNANGEMAVDTWIDGYYVDESGKWIKDPKNEEHTHKWVEETETVNHPEESHIEIKHHDAVTHTVNHDEEFHYEHDKPYRKAKPYGDSAS